ncbi:MAG: flagellar hook-length control protein FliK [Candidatus Latescibacterota bacterium]|nr:flagellar hook-length control protein FliK [Candidatus Latescibacterota bacterium]
MMESIDKGRQAPISGVRNKSNSASSGNDDEDGMNFADVFDKIQRDELMSNRNDRKNKDERDYLMSLASEDVGSIEFAKDRGDDRTDRPAISKVFDSSSADESKKGTESLDDEATPIDDKDDLGQMWSKKIESTSDLTQGEDSESAEEQGLELSSTLQSIPGVSGDSLDNPFDLLSMTELVDPDFRVESSPQQIISRIAQASGTHGPMSEKLADVVFPQVIRSFATLVRGENAEMRLQLQPGDLGEIELRVRTTEAIVRGEMMVQNPEVKALLEKHMERLRAALAEEGLELAGFDVDLGNEGSSDNMDEEEQHSTPLSTRSINSTPEDLVNQTSSSPRASERDNDLDITA